MTDMLYEKQGSYLQGVMDEHKNTVKLVNEERQKANKERLAEKMESAKAMLAEGDSIDKIQRVLKLSDEQVQEL